MFFVVRVPKCSWFGASNVQVRCGLQKGWRTTCLSGAGLQAGAVLISWKGLHLSGLREYLQGYTTVESLCSIGHQSLVGLRNAKEAVGSSRPGNYPLWLGFSPRGWTEQPWDSRFLLGG